MQAMEKWPLTVTQIADLASSPPPDKHQLVNIIRAKSAGNEMPYLRQTQQHARLRTELLRLGS